MALSSRLGPDLGQSESSYLCDGSALRFLRACRACSSLPEEAHEGGAAGESLYVFMRTLLHFMPSRAIPRFFKDDSEPAPQGPSSPAPAPAAQGSPLEKYAGLILKHIRKSNPNHPDFADLLPDKYPQWRSDLRPKLEKAHARLKASLPSGGAAFGAGAASLPLRKSSSVLHACTAGGGNLESCGLQHAALSLLRKAGPRKRLCQEALWLAAGSEATSRSGEVRLQNYSEWQWHPYLSAAGIKWKEMKTLESYGMPMPQLGI